MPQRLQTLELQGYKTFANRTRFEFGPRITAIVGPNGSGKSNIADALRWVLGEQSYALLRAHRTEDMIFAGSTQRPQAGLASATVTFDNTDHWLPIDYTEVAITRRAARDGQNEYLLNGQRVRLRDVRELLGHAGLTEHTYTFISQGLVDASLALRPDERRQMLEGAAGIGLYRQRREETLRRLEATQRNLERAQDILAELEPRLQRLARQAQRAREAAQIQADLAAMLREWYGFHWHDAQKRLADARRLAATQTQRLEAATARQQALAAQLASLRSQIARQRETLAGWHKEAATHHRRLEAVARQVAVLGERRKALQSRRDEWRSEIAQLEAHIQQQELRLQESQTEVENRRRALEEALKQREEARRALETLLNDRRKAQHDLEQTRQAMETLVRKEAALDARRADLSERKSRLRAELQQASEALPPLEKTQREAEKALQEAKARLEHAASEHLKAQQAVEAARSRLRRAEEGVAQARRAFHDLQAQITTTEAQAQVLEEAERTLAGYTEGARWLLGQAQRHKLGLQGALAQHLQVPAELETAIAAALDRLTEAVLLNDDGETALTLSAQAPARVALLPLPHLNPGQPLVLPPGEDILGIAAALVEAPPALRPAVEALLGHILIVRHREAARRVLPKMPPYAWAVTLQGEAFSPRGIVVVGRASSSPLRRPRERRQLASRLKALRAQAEQRAAALQKAEASLADAQEALRTAEANLRRAEETKEEARQAEARARSEAENARRALERQREELDRLTHTLHLLEEEAAALSAEASTLQNGITTARTALQQHEEALRQLDTTEANAQEAHWATQAALAEQALQEARRRLGEQKALLNDLRQRQAERQARLQTAEEELASLAKEHQRLNAEAESIRAIIEQLQGQIAPAQQALDEAEKQREVLETKAEHLAQEVHIAERHHTQAQMALTRAQETLDHLRRRMEEDLGPVALDYEPNVSGPQPLPLEGMVAQLPRVATLPEGLDKRIKERRAQLRRLGAINPEAEQEYEEVRARYDFLTTQRDDLLQAEADIRQVIAELEDLMQQTFQKTFEAVNREFGTIFTRLFGGGSAQLVLTEPNDITRTGVEIEARLPGKRTQRLAMLSGGERSLTAVALIFALLKASPTPFCVLDEVDAMLDEANVGRFRGLLEELSEHTQFIIITHNRNTVQAAEVIYGVTLAPDATSQVVSLKLDEVAKMKGLR